MKLRRETYLAHKRKRTNVNCRCDLGLLHVALNRYRHTAATPGYLKENTSNTLIQWKMYSPLVSSRVGKLVTTYNWKLINSRAEKLRVNTGELGQHVYTGSMRQLK